MLINSKTINITLSSSGWSGNNYKINNSDINSNSDIHIGFSTNITQTQLESFANAMIIGSSQTNGSFTLKCLGTKPTINIPITLTIGGVL